MHWIDWSIIVVLLAGLTWLTLATRRYVRSVADFLAANRVAGRYLLTVSQGIGGGIAIIGAWEMIYTAGFPSQWWQLMSIPVGLFLSLTGFIVYRYRQTRALTLAQFFEMRYSRRFRFFSGLLCWISGVFNYAIFPAVTARFMLFFFGLPDFWQLGPWSVPMHPTVMAAYLGFALFVALSGGQITIMITDFVQGILTLVIFVVLMIYLVFHFSWADLVAGLQMAPEGKSMLNPFKTAQAADFNIWYFLIMLAGTIYNSRSWQGSSGYNAAAKTPHEARMAGMLSQWREHAKTLCLMLIPLVAFAVLHLPKFAEWAAPVQAQIAAITDPIVRGQMTVPVFLTHFLPVGFIGLFAAVILCGTISCDDTYLHAWGTIFVQDVLMPLRKKPLAAAAHLRWLRVSITGVALFGFLFSLFFPLKDFIYMYFALTGSIYLGGAGAVIIGGLYWKRGTAPAAWTAMIAGSILAFGGMVLQQLWPGHVAPWLAERFPDSAWLALHMKKCPVNGAMGYFIAMVVSTLSYVLVSLLGPRREHDMDRLLHRGAYAVAQDVVRVEQPAQRGWAVKLGLNLEFSRRDRILFWATLWWSLGWWLIFLVGTAVNLIWHLSDESWSWFWWFKVWVSFGLGIFTTVWMVLGGLADSKQLFRDLRKIAADEADDGTVTNGK